MRSSQVTSAIRTQFKCLWLSSGHHNSTSKGFMTWSGKSSHTCRRRCRKRREKEVSDWNRSPQGRWKSPPADSELIVWWSVMDVTRSVEASIKIQCLSLSGNDLLDAFKIKIFIPNNLNCLIKKANFYCVFATLRSLCSVESCWHGLWECLEEILIVPPHFTTLPQRHSTNSSGCVRQNDVDSLRDSLHFLWGWHYPEVWCGVVWYGGQDRKTICCSVRSLMWWHRDINLIWAV